MAVPGVLSTFFSFGTSGAATAATKLAGSVSTLGKGLFKGGLSVSKFGARVGVAGVTSIGKGAVTVGTKLATTPRYTAVPVKNALVTAQSVAGRVYQVESTLLGAVWSILLFIVGAVILRISPTLLQWLNSALSPFIGVGESVERRMNDLRKILKDKPSVTSSILQAVLILAILVVTLVVAIVMVFLQLFVQCIRFRFELFVILICKLVFTYIEQHYALLLDVVHTIIIIAETGTNTLAGGLNVLLEVRDMIMPIINEQIYTSIETMTLLYNQFSDPDVKNSGGRRLEDAAIFEFGERKVVVDDTVTTVTYGLYLYNRVSNTIMAFQLALIQPFFELILDVVTKVFAKISCAFAGGIVCTLRELGNLILVTMVGFVNVFAGALGSPIPLPRTGCTAKEITGGEELGGECGGYITDLEPAGAFFANLASGIRRRLSQLICEKSKDGSYREIMDGRVMHQSRTRPCPLSKQTLLGEENTILAFHHAEITDNCLLICVNGVQWRTCHEVNNHTRHLTGTCDNTDLTGHWDARRRLAPVYDNHWFTWSEEVPPPPPNEIVRKINEYGDVFDVGGLHCDLRNSATAQQQFINMLCIIYRTYEEINHSGGSGGGRTLDETPPSLTPLTKVLGEMKRAHQYLKVRKQRNLRSMARTAEMMRPIQRRRSLAETAAPRKQLEIGSCVGEDMYPCPSGECIPYKDRDLCTPIDYETAGILDVVAQTLHDSTQFSIDLDSVIAEEIQCQKDYRTHPSTLPFTYANLEARTGRFCLGLSPPFPFRFQRIEVKGINRFVSSACNFNGTNTCACYWYYQSKTVQDVFSFSFVHLDIEQIFVNSLLFWHQIVYGTLLQLWPLYYFDDVWYWFWLNLLGDQVAPIWFLRLFGNIGLDDVSLARGWICAGLHAGSVFTLYLAAIVAVILWAASKPVRKWVKHIF